MNDQYPSETANGAAPPETAETPEPVTTLSESEIVAQIRERFVAGINDSHNRREEWRLNWRAYNNQYDDPSALPWQCDVILPRVSRMCHTLGKGIKDAATRGTRDWYTCTEETPFGELAAPIHSKLIRANLDKCEFSQTIEPAVVSGLITCAAAYIASPDNDTWPGYTKIEPVDMRCLIRDPSARDEWIIQTSVMPYAAAKALGMAKGWNIEALEASKGVGATLDSRIQAFIADVSHVAQPATTDATAKTVVIEEYWGPLYTTDGEADVAFGYVVTANREKLLYGPIPDPTEDKQSPYIQRDLMPALFDAYAKSYVEDGRPIAQLLNQVFRRMMDGLAYSVLRAWVLREELITPDSLEDLQQHGVQPGTIVIQREGDGEALSPLNTGSFPPEALALFQILCQEWEEATGVTRLAQGLPNSSGAPSDKTLGQTQIRANAASRGLDGLTASFEDNTLAPLVRKMVRHQQLFTNLRDHRIDDLCHDEIEEAVKKAAAYLREELTEQMKAAMSPEMSRAFDEFQQQMGVQSGQGPSEDPEIQRGSPEWEAALDLVQKAMSEPLNVRVSGLTGVVEKDAKQQLMGAWIEQSLQLPGGPEELHTPKIMKLSAHRAGFDPEDGMVDDADKAWMMARAQEMAMEMVQQMMAQRGLMAPQGGPEQSNA